MNVCIYRIPAGQSIVWPPSSCPKCGNRIRFYDNIPVISYLLLLGKCRQCKVYISLRYPVVELISGLLSVALYIRYGLSPQYLLYLLFSYSLIVISFIDIDHQIIPDVISLPGILIGLIISIVQLNQISGQITGQVNWLDSLIGIACGGGSLFLIAFVFEKLTGKEGMGGGDIKLLAMIGAWMGWKALPFVVFLSSVSGTIIGGGALLLSRKNYRTRIPFGPFLALSALVFFFFGEEIVLWYYNRIISPY